MTILYSTHCPKCNILETKMKQKNITYGIIDDINIMIDKGFDFLPILEVNGNLMEFSDAVKWVNSQEGNNGN